MDPPLKEDRDVPSDDDSSTAGDKTEEKESAAAVPDTDSDENTTEQDKDDTESPKKEFHSPFGDGGEGQKKCTYRDFSHIPPPAPKQGQWKRHGKEPTFPMKLHMMLSTPDFSHIITWQPHGRSWRILKQNEFEQQVIPLFFRHGRYSSFARQVSGWGFRRIIQGSDWNSYYHELFLRGMPHLCEKMRRLTSSDETARKKAEKEAIPDLTAISKEHPLPEGPQLSLPAVLQSASSIPAFPLAGANLPPGAPPFNVDAALMARAEMQRRADMVAASRLRQDHALASFFQQRGGPPGAPPPHGLMPPGMPPDDVFLAQLAARGGMPPGAPPGGRPPMMAPPPGGGPPPAASGGGQGGVPGNPYENMFNMNNSNNM